MLAVLVLGVLLMMGRRGWWNVRSVVECWWDLFGCVLISIFVICGLVRGGGLGLRRGLGGGVWESMVG